MFRLIVHFQSESYHREYELTSALLALYFIEPVIRKQIRKYGYMKDRINTSVIETDQSKTDQAKQILFNLFLNMNLLKKD